MRASRAAAGTVGAGEGNEVATEGVAVADGAEGRVVTADIGSVVLDIGVAAVDREIAGLDAADVEAETMEVVPEMDADRTTDTKLSEYARRRRCWWFVRGLGLGSRRRREGNAVVADDGERMPRPGRERRQLFNSGRRQRSK